MRSGEGNIERTGAQMAIARFRRDIHSVFAHCLPSQRFSKTLSYVLYDAGCKIFRIHSHRDRQEPVKGDSAFWRQRLVGLLQGLYKVGLGGDNAQKAFAHSMDRLMDTFISSQYVKVDWFTKKSIVPHLRMFMRDGFCPLVELVLGCLHCESSSVHPAELQSWQEMALGRLGRARVNHLFDFVLHWDKTLGAIRDIKVNPLSIITRTVLMKNRNISDYLVRNNISQAHSRNKCHGDYFIPEQLQPTF
jgi:anaphase-promoting complex subunit 2